MILQLDLFKKENDLLLEEMRYLRESHDKIRKSLFARHGELAKNYLNLVQRMDIIERHICHNHDGR